MQLMEGRYIVLDRNTSTKIFTDAQLSCEAEGGILPTSERIHNAINETLDLVLHLADRHSFGYFWSAECGTKECMVFTFTRGVRRLVYQMQNMSSISRRHPVHFQVCRCKEYG